MNSSMKQESELKLTGYKICFYITIISNLILYIAQPFNITILETLASRCLMLCNLAAFTFAILQSMKHYVPYKTVQIVTIFFMISFACVSFLLSSSGGIYNLIIRLWCYLALPIYFLYIDYLEPEKKLFHFIFAVNFITSLIFIYLSFSSYSYKGYEGYLGTANAWLTLGYENPNQTAMYLLINLIVLLCALYYYKKKVIKIILLFDLLFIGWLIIQTSSRTCILIGLLVIVISIFKKKYKIKRYIVVGILIIPLIFMIIYPLLYDKGWLYFFEFVGKADYSSRSYIFKSAIASVRNQFMFGDFGRYQLQNIHNGPLSVYTSLGLVGLILFYIYYYRAYFHILSKGMKSRVAFISVIGLLSVFLHACSESAFIIGGSMFAGSLSTLIFMTKLEGKEVHKD